MANVLLHAKHLYEMAFSQEDKCSLTLDTDVNVSEHPWKKGINEHLLSATWRATIYGTCKIEQISAIHTVQLFESPSSLIPNKNLTKYFILFVKRFVRLNNVWLIVKKVQAKEQKRKKRKICIDQLLKEIHC